MQKLVESGMSVEGAWEYVCNDSGYLGHYRNSENAKHRIEPSGSREICGFFDLANVRKILAWDDEEKSFYFAGGSYLSDSSDWPLVRLSSNNYDCDSDRYGAVGWIVLS